MSPSFQFRLHHASIILPQNVWEEVKNKLKKNKNLIKTKQKWLVWPYKLHSYLMT